MTSRIALVHDFLVDRGGAEKVLLVLSDLFPDAPIYTSVYNPRTTFPQLAARTIRTSFLQRINRWKALYRLSLPLYPRAFAGFDLRGYDIILSHTTSFAKGIRVPAGARHLCYCHTPPRFLWGLSAYGPHEHGWAAAGLLGPLLRRLREWDRAAARRVDLFIAGSRNAARRIRACYGRRAIVIPPPIEVARYERASSVEDWFLVVSRLLPYKRVDLAVRACSRLGAGLIVVGEGRDEARLRRMAGPRVQFRGWVEEGELRALYARCRALLVPGEEDFGLAALEAQAAGRPVVAFATGGALETVIEGVTGTFFAEPTVEALSEALCSFDPAGFDPELARANARRFDRPVFEARFRRLVARAAKRPRRSPLPSLPA